MKSFLDKILLRSNNLDYISKNIQDLSQKTPVKKIFDAISNYSSESEVRYVGGCIRKIIDKKKVDDIDLATNLEPKEVCSALKDRDINFYETGYEHGTVTALIDDYKAVKRKVGMVKIPNSKFTPWQKRAAYQIDYYNFTFNEGNQKGYVKLSDGSMKKLDFINFMPESITITNPLYGYTSYGSDGMEDRFKISRVDGSIFKQSFRSNDTFVSEGRGTCKKSESKNTLF